MKRRGLGAIRDPRVHVLRDGHLRRSDGTSAVHAISVITEGFRLPDEALRAIYEYTMRFAAGDGNGGRSR